LESLNHKHRSMNTINIVQRYSKPHPKYNTVLTFNEAVKESYGVIRQWLGEELSKGEEVFDGKVYTWRMNLSNDKIEIIVKALKMLTKKLQEPHGYSDNVIPDGRVNN
jgi:hypothetical protein